MNGMLRKFLKKLYHLYLQSTIYFNSLSLVFYIVITFSYFNDYIVIYVISSLIVVIINYSLILLYIQISNFIFVYLIRLIIIKSSKKINNEEISSIS